MGGGGRKGGGRSRLEGACLRLFVQAAGSVARVGNPFFGKGECNCEECSWDVTGWRPLDNNRAGMGMRWGWEWISTPMKERGGRRDASGAESEPA